MTDDGNGNGAARHFYLFRVASDTQRRTTVSTAFGILASNHIRMQYMHFLVVLVTRQNTNNKYKCGIENQIKSNFTREKSMRPWARARSISRLYVSYTTVILAGASQLEPAGAMWSYIS